MAEEIAQERSKRHWGAALAAAAAFLFVGVFAARTAMFVYEFRTSGAPIADERFSAERSVSVALLSRPIPEGAFQMATADDPALGVPEATVTVVMFADFGCPFSQRSAYAMRALAAKYGDRLRYVYRDFPVPELHPEAIGAAEAASCAGEQGKFWEMHDRLYQHQNDFSEAALIGHARGLNLDTSAFRACVQSGRFAGEVVEDTAAGLAAGVQGTPTFFVNGTRIPGAIPEPILDGIIANLLAK